MRKKFSASASALDVGIIFKLLSTSSGATDWKLLRDLFTSDQNILRLFINSCVLALEIC